MKLKSVCTTKEAIRKGMTFLSFLDILLNSAFKWVYLSFSPLPLASLLFCAICKGSFAFLHFVFLGMVFISASCTMP